MLFKLWCLSAEGGGLKTQNPEVSRSPDRDLVVDVGVNSRRFLITVTAAKEYKIPLERRGTPREE
jgi:hypothetical protein